MILNNKKQTNKTHGKAEKGFAFSGIFMMVMSLFAFSFVISEGERVSGAENSKPPSAAILNPTKEIATAAFTPSVTSSTAKQVVQFQEGNYLITKGALKVGEKVSATNLYSGKTGELTLDSSVIDSARSATEIESTFGNQAITFPAVSGGGTIETTFANSLYDGSWKDIPSETLNKIGVEKISSLEDGNIEVLTTKGVKSVYNPTTGAIIGTPSQQKTFSFFGTTLNGVWAHLAEGAVWAGGIAAAIQFLGPMIGLREETTSALTKSAVIGVVAWKGLDIGAEYFAKNLKFLPEVCLKNPAQGLGWCSAGAGFAVGVIAFLLLYSEEEEKVVQFTCLPWEAPVGGITCEECNNQAGGLPCSEYQCKSLGQACELVNPGTEEEKCVWVNRQDVNPPVIEPLTSALGNDYRYAPDNAISPPDRGVKINYLKANDNCIPAFTPLQLGVKLNEPAKCKIDVSGKSMFGNMTSFMSSGLLRYNHIYALSLPGSSALEGENITVQNNGNYNLYVRCEDANGNSNKANFVFKYCVDPGPDTTPPIIVTTNVLNNAPVAYNKSSVDLEVYTNEPASCKWSHNDRDYSSMEEKMQCSSSIFESNAQMLYKCSTKLTGLNDRTDNKFYFRCLDQPSKPENKRNANSESYEFTLKGTQPLVIDEATPTNETIKDSTSPVKVMVNVTTSAGFDKGNSTCYYSPTGDEGSYIKFFKTNSYKHTQDLFLTEGNYDYFVKCTDLGGNSDYETINFDVETDTQSPGVVRAYKEENYLKITTNEKGSCVYSTFDCNYDFNEGTKFTTTDDKNHFTKWDVQTNLYVKCSDNFGNQPLPNQCSIKVRASNFVK